MEPLIVFRFGPYELRPRTRELFKHGVKVRLRPQPFRVLQTLLERKGDVVTREELSKLLWPSGTFVDFEHGVNTLVKELRGVLNDSATEPRYIQTLPKLGYRIIVPVEADGLAPVNLHAAADAQTVISESNAVKDEPSSPILRARALRSWPVFLGISVVLIVLTVAYSKWPLSRTRPQASTGQLMLAVLPFENLTGDASQDYFSDGLTEEMIAQLGHLDPERLGVIARTSVMHYQHSQQPLQQIGHDLRVQYVLEGSVRRDSKNVRINVEMIQISNQKSVWSRQYDRELTSLLALQSEIAQEITDEIQLTLGDSRKRPATAPKPATSPASYEAYDLYLKGRYFWNKRSAQGFQQATGYFQQAIAKDPNYARAYAGLADSYALTASYNLAPQKELMPKARAAALRALQIDDSLAEAHASLALIAENYDWDWQTAGKEFRRAIELDPNYPTAHEWYAEYLAWQGRFDEAFAESERARQLDPLSFIIATDHTAILLYSRQYDRAIEQLRTVLDLQPDFPRANGLVLGANVQKGQFANALAEIEKWRHMDDSPGIWALQAYVYGRAGQKAQARRSLAKFEQLNQHGPWQVDSAVFHAFAYAGIGDKEKLFASLQQAFADRSPTLVSLKVDPAFDPYRSDPRFQALLRTVHLSP